MACHTHLLRLLSPNVLASPYDIAPVAVPVLDYCRYDIAQHMADRYKWLAKLIFIVQLLVSWAIVFISTLYASWDGRQDYEGGEGARWIVSDSNTITALGEVVFFLAVGASFLISFDSYINAKARANNQPVPPLCLTPCGTGSRPSTSLAL